MAEAEQKEEIKFQDFLKLDLRVGKVISAQIPDWSQKLLELKVDLGPTLGQKSIMAGLKEWYEPSQLEGNHYLFVANLEEKKMGPAVSQGMILAADDGQQALLLPVSKEIKPGTVVH